MLRELLQQASMLAALPMLGSVGVAGLSMQQLTIDQQCHAALVQLERYPDLWNAWVANRMSLLVSGLLMDDAGGAICTQTELDLLEIGLARRPATVSSLEAWRKIFGDHCPGGPSISLCSYFQGCALLPHSIAHSADPGDLEWVDLHKLCSVNNVDESWVSKLVQAAQQPARGIAMPLTRATQKFDYKDGF